EAIAPASTVSTPCAGSLWLPSDTCDEQPATINPNAAQGALTAIAPAAIEYGLRRGCWDVATRNAHRALDPFRDHRRAGALRPAAPSIPNRTPPRDSGYRTLLPWPVPLERCLARSVHEPRR